MADQKQNQNQSSDNTPARKVNSNLETEHGTTTIDDGVVGKIAGLATREVSGVAALGSTSQRVMGSIRQTFGSEDVKQGVSVEVEEGTAHVEVAITAEYGVAIHELADAIRRNVISAVERMTGLDVSGVDVNVHDVKLPGDDEEEQGDEQTAISSGQDR